MSTRTDDGSLGAVRHPVAIEAAAIAGVFVGLSLWQALSRRAFARSIDLPIAAGPLLDNALLYTGGFLLGLVAFAVVYVRARDVRVGTRLPTRTDLPTLAIAVGLPVALVATTKLVGVLTGVGYNELTMTAVAAEAPLAPILTVHALGLLFTVTGLVVVCQVLVQGSARRVLRPGTAVGATTVAGGFLLLSDTGGLTVVPDRGPLAAAVLFAVSLAVAIAAREVLDGRHRRVRLLGAAPLVGLSLVIVVATIAGLETMAGVCFAATHLATFGLAALAYERTDSVVPSALAYASLYVSNVAVVVVFEAGLQGW